jgi:hypothetical protein
LDTFLKKVEKLRIKTINKKRKMFISKFIQFQSIEIGDINKLKRLNCSLYPWNKPEGVYIKTSTAKYMKGSATR